MDGINEAEIGNNSQLFISTDYGSETPTWVEVLKAQNITLPDQKRNTVDRGHLNQTDGITKRAKGTTSGGDFSSTVLCGAEENLGLIALLAAKESDDDVALKVVYSDGSYHTLPAVAILGCEPSSIENDKALSYEVSGACNAKTIFTPAA